MHDETIDAYNRSAEAWRDRRPPQRLDDARTFAELVDGTVVDLGCGPGSHLGSLETGKGGAVGMDASLPMLHLARSAHPGTPLAGADIEELPLAPGSVAGIWASKSLVHLPRARVPRALAQMHRSLQPDGHLRLVLFGGDREHDTFPDDDFPGRKFSLWSVEHLTDVLIGAGFVDLHIHLAPPNDPKGSVPPILVSARRSESLPDTVDRGMRVLIVGLNPSPASADAGVGFARPGNRFWPAALAAGLVGTDRDPWRALDVDAVGMTDLVKRTTRKASEVSAAEFRDGANRLERLVRWLEPGATCFVGLSGWRAARDRHAKAGPVEGGFGGRPAYVMGSTSGLNAHAQLGDLTEHLRLVGRLADTVSP